MQLESNNFLIRKRRNGLFSQKMQLLESDYSNKFSDSAFFESFLWLFLVKALTLRVQPPSFLTLPELENGKPDWAEIFTIDRARKIRPHIFERFFFSDPFTPFFGKNVSHRDKDFGMKNWSDWAEIFTRADHDPSPELFFFCFEKSLLLPVLSRKYGKVS